MGPGDKNVGTGKPRDCVPAVELERARRERRTLRRVGADGGSAPHAATGAEFAADTGTLPREPAIGGARAADVRGAIRGRSGTDPRGNGSRLRGAHRQSGPWA